MQSLSTLISEVYLKLLMVMGLGLFMAYFKEFLRSWSFRRFREQGLMQSMKALNANLFWPVFYTRPFHLGMFFFCLFALSANLLLFLILPLYPFGLFSGEGPFSAPIGLYHVIFTYLFGLSLNLMAISFFTRRESFYLFKEYIWNFLSFLLVFFSLIIGLIKKSDIESLKDVSLVFMANSPISFFELVLRGALSFLVFLFFIPCHLLGLFLMILRIILIQRNIANPSPF